MKSLLYCQDPGKAGENFIPAKRDHVITPLGVCVFQSKMKSQSLKYCMLKSKRFEV